MIKKEEINKLLKFLPYILGLITGLLVVQLMNFIILDKFFYSFKGFLLTFFIGILLCIIYEKLKKSVK